LFNNNERHTHMHSNNPIVPYISLCSGYEGIGLGLHRCIQNLRCVAYCEREAFAIANLVAKMESGLLDAAPVFTDVTNFPWADYAPYMAGGILSFGWPCQPVSCAGKRKATEDERWLFDIIADGISILRPGMLFAENVEGLLSARMPDGSSVFGHCIERLESLHYKVAAGIFSASEVGAPHQRKRVFILAHRSGEGFQGREWIGQTRTQWESSGHATECSSSMAYATGWRGEGLHDGNAEPENAIPRCAWPSRPGEPQHGFEPPRVVENTNKLRLEEHGLLNASVSVGSSGGSDGEAMEDAKFVGRRGRSDGDAGGLCGEIQAAGSCGGGTEAMGNAEYAGSQGQWNDTASEHRSDERLQLGTANGNDSDSGQTQPALGGDIDGSADRLDYAELFTTCDNRTDELRLLGNGVVPATAERAFRVLTEELSQKK
jgi:DNA (cytosine-5)-methyltransferase 1